MRPECSDLEAAVTIQIELAENGDFPAVEVEFVNNFTTAVWLPQEPTPAYRINANTGAVLISYGYFEDVYGSYRGRYMLPQMAKLAPSETLRWRIDNRALVEKMLVPGVPVQLRMRVALVELPVSNVRGRQPLDEYLEHSCTLQTGATVLRPP